MLAAAALDAYGVRAASQKLASPDAFSVGGVQGDMKARGVCQHR